MAPVSSNNAVRKALFPSAEPPEAAPAAGEPAAPAAPAVPVVAATAAFVPARAQSSKEPSELNPAEKKAFFDTVGKVGKEYALGEMNKHWSAIKTEGVGYYAGPKTTYYRRPKLDESGKVVKDAVGEIVYRPTTDAEKLAVLKKRFPQKSAAEIAKVKARIDKTACIVLAMKALEKGYIAAGQGKRWAEINEIVGKAGTIGSVLLRELRKDGWQAVYFNADTSFYPPNPEFKKRYVAQNHDHFQKLFLNSDGSLAATRIKNTVDAGRREYERLGDTRALEKGTYHGVQPDFALVNFRDNKLYETTGKLVERQDVLDRLKDVPFAIGIAASGYHTYMMSGKEVLEAHSTREPWDPTNFEHRNWSGIGLEDGGGLSRMQSGIFVVPPGTFK